MDGTIMTSRNFVTIALKLASIIVFIIALFFTPFSQAEQILHIKYRATFVDVDKPYFEYLDTSKSSWIEGAWYDKSKQYLIINLKGTNYHYCSLDEGTWRRFKGSSSFGSAYSASIKGNFDCRVFPVPDYSQ